MFTPESNSSKTLSSKRPPPPPPKPDDGFEDDGDEDLLGSEEDTPRRRNNNGSKNSAKGQEQTGGNYKGKQVEWGGGQCLSTGVAENIVKNSEGDTVTKIPRFTEAGNRTTEGIVSTPIAMYDKITGCVIDLSDQLEKKAVESKNEYNPELENNNRGKGETNQEYIIVHCADGIRQIKKSQWPVMKLNEVEIIDTQGGEEEMCKEIFPSQESMELGEMEKESDNMLSEHDREVFGININRREEVSTDDEKTRNEASEVWEQTTIPRKKGHKRSGFCPAIATRVSSRIKSHGGLHGVVVNEGFQDAGMCQSSLNSFAILNSCENDDLQMIALNYDIGLGGVVRKQMRLLMLSN
ncbi:hypothetical protein HU200_053930 [Digitaria exilis]|uniref:Uncharacterized protein n=1 Tax=Digitaria exilis TaxID=1010633 RepID=A0A835E7A4_9POAL|nr:hypothetical protein HU200_053930 [Digitaria exilis]